jgi:hypothetical protein
MRKYKIIPRAQISKEGWASKVAIYSIGAYKADIYSFTVVKTSPSGLKVIPKSVITNIS